MMESVGLIASFIMGVTLGLMGGGGSILTVPIFVYLFALSPLVATGYSLFVVGVTAFAGSLLYLRKGDIDFRVALVFAIPSIVGVNLSRGTLIPQIPDVVFRIGDFAVTKEAFIMMAFAALMVLASYSMIKKKNDHKKMMIHPLLRTSLIGIQGLVVGMVAGFVGAGGGFLIVPALVFMVGLSMRIAVGTSLMIIAVQSLLGFAGDVSRGLLVNWSLLGAVTGFAIFGIGVGSMTAHKIQEQKLKTTFGWFVLVMGVSILIEQLHQLSF